MQAALLIRREKQRLRGGKVVNFRELPSNFATRLIPPFPRYPPRSYIYGVSIKSYHENHQLLKRSRFLCMNIIGQQHEIMYNLPRIYDRIHYEQFNMRDLLIACKKHAIMIDVFALSHYIAVIFKKRIFCVSLTRRSSEVETIKQILMTFSKQVCKLKFF